MEKAWKKTLRRARAPARRRRPGGIRQGGFRAQALLADDPGRKTHLGSAISAATRLEAPPLLEGDVAAARRQLRAARAPSPARAAQARAGRRRGKRLRATRARRVRGRGRRGLRGGARGAQSRGAFSCSSTSGFIIGGLVVRACRSAACGDRPGPG